MSKLTVPNTKGQNMATKKKFQGIDDSEFLTAIFSPTCFFCVHLQEANNKTRRCAAFQEAGSIPLSMWNGEVDHAEPVQGDGGVVFKKRPAESGPPPYTSADLPAEE
jgi:hypothetical protein